VVLHLSASLFEKVDGEQTVTSLLEYHKIIDLIEVSDLSSEKVGSHPHAKLAKVDVGIDMKLPGIVPLSFASVGVSVRIEVLTTKDQLAKASDYYLDEASLIVTNKLQQLAEQLGGKVPFEAEEG
jgi:hypothetical protein